MAGIFICYRRDDSFAYANNLYDKLSDHPASPQVLFDVDSLQPGENYKQIIEHTCSSSDVLLAVIGKTWATAKNESDKLRLHDQHDFVRLEIACALKQRIRVIPVLVDGAKMPDSKLLPSDIADLSDLHALEINNKRYKESLDEIVNSVAKILTKFRKEEKSKSVGRSKSALGGARRAGIPTTLPALSQRMKDETSSARPSDWSPTKSGFRVASRPSPALISGSLPDSKQTKIVKATRKYEAWRAEQANVVASDLRMRHQFMSQSAFSMFRTSFYRWLQLLPKICPEASKAPTVLAIGDLHLENFGTWRDAEGRLVWGVNDFEEASALPYTSDLVRLATGALLAISEGHISVKGKDACAAILEGYTDSLRRGGNPFILAENHNRLRAIAMSELRDPLHFWQKMDALPTVRSDVPASAREALEQSMPMLGLNYRMARRVAGLGSLGLMRLIAIADWRGARIAREAKAAGSPSVYWVTKSRSPGEIMHETIINHAVRCPDPYLQLRNRWIVRRIAPDCGRIELSSLSSTRDHRLLLAMGWETANIHLGSGNRDKVLKHLKKQKNGWLMDSAKEMARAVTNDWHEWRKSGYR